MSHLIIKPETDTLFEYLHRINQFKSLIWIMTVRDLKIKYAQTVLGLSWAILQPLSSLLIYTLFFRYIVKFPSLEDNYEAQVFTGIIAWNLFSYIILQAAPSLQNQRDLLTRLHFPKIILLISKTLVGVIDAAISFVLLFAFLLFTGYPLDLKLLFLPVIIAVNIIAGFSIALWISSLSLIKRDIIHVMNFALRFGIWFTPVFYTLEMIPKAYQSFVYFNPMTTIIGFYRFVFIDGMSIPPSSGLYSVAILIAVGFFGLIKFKNIEDRYAEVM